MSAENRESSKTLWAVIFVLLSVLAHITGILSIVIIARYLPAPKIETSPQAVPQITLSLLPLPPIPKPHPTVKRYYTVTNPDAATKVVQNTPMESDNTTALRSQNQKARAPDSMLPDMTGSKIPLPNFQDSPPSPQSQTAQTGANQSKAEKNQQQSEEQMRAQQPQPQPPQPTPKPPEPAPPKPPVQLALKNDFDPNGLPLLPPIPAPTLEPQQPVSTVRQVQSQAGARPPPSFQLNKSDVAGSQGALGANSLAANASEMGRYKAKFYRAVGSRWYAKVGQAFQILPVGTVRIQYTIHSDGTVDNIKVLEGNNSMLQILLSISQNSITEASPFDPFPDAVRKEVGESYTDDFTFSIYGG